MEKIITLYCGIVVVMVYFVAVVSVGTLVVIDMMYNMKYNDCNDNSNCSNVIMSVR
jgi:hypothetical protein